MHYRAPVPTKLIIQEVKGSVFQVDVALLPSLATVIKIAVYMLLAWYATRELSGPLSRALDASFHIHGSIRLVSDALYMVLQIPVMLIYCGYLNAQLA